jgi:hypothetical protein
MYPFQLPASRVNPAQRKRDRRPIFPSVTAGDAEFYKELWKPIRKIRIKRNKKKELRYIIYYVESWEIFKEIHFNKIFK